MISRLVSCFLNVYSTYAHLIFLSLEPTIQVEVSVSGDFTEDELEALAARYLGSLPPSAAPSLEQVLLGNSNHQDSQNGARDVSPAQRAAVLACAPPNDAFPLLTAMQQGGGSDAASEEEEAEHDDAAAPLSSYDLMAKSPLASPFVAPSSSSPASKHVSITVPDSDPRALIHCSGVAPNKWGKMRDGSDVRHHLGVFPLSDKDRAAADAYQFHRYGALCTTGNENDGDAAAAAAAAIASATATMNLADLPSGARRAQPLWPAAALMLAQEVLNRRLFSEVRERRGLTYDANFQVLYSCVALGCDCVLANRGFFFFKGHHGGVSFLCLPFR